MAGRQEDGQAAATIWSIQYLRAIAAIGVVVFHTLTETGYDFEFGSVGVDLFFGISGFLMFYVTHSKPIRPHQFLWRRFVRIAPLYWFATLLTVGGTFVWPGFFWQASHEVRRVVLSLLFIPQNGVEGDIYPVLYQGWTLQYEAFFYVLFALSLSLRGIWRLVAMTAVIGALVVVGWTVPATNDPLFVTYTNPIALEFVAGAWVGWACTRPWPGGARWRAAYLMLLTGGWAMLWTAWRNEGPWGPWSLAATIAAIAAILAGSVWLERYGAMPKLRCLRVLGEASYAIYLFQDMGFASVADWIDGRALAVSVIVQTMAAILLGLLIYVCLERPFDRFVRARAGKATAPRESERWVRPAEPAPAPL